MKFHLKNTVLMGLGVLGGHLFDLRKPLNVMLSVTNHCPSHCSYCDIPDRKQREMTTEEIFSLIDQLAKAGTQRLGIWGGEPLLRNDITQIINYAKSKGMFVSMDSNGYLLPSKIEQVKNLDHLVIALDGPQEMHDTNRQKGAFEKAMAAIETATGKIPLWTITVLTKHNLEGIDFILEQSRKYGFLPSFQVVHHNDILGHDCSNFIPEDKSYRQAIGKLIDLKKKGVPMVSSLSYLEHLLSWPDFSKPMLPSQRFRNLKCWAAQLFCNVDTDGSVYPCSLLIEKMPALNFLEVSFKKAFEEMKEIPCQACNASCYTEYNFIYSLDFRTIWDWLKAIRKSQKPLHKK